MPNLVNNMIKVGVIPNCIYDCQTLSTDRSAAEMPGAPQMAIDDFRRHCEQATGCTGANFTVLSDAVTLVECPTFGTTEIRRTSTE